MKHRLIIEVEDTKEILELFAQSVMRDVFTRKIGLIKYEFKVVL